MSFDASFDWVCAGSGLASVTAALAAHDEGLSVLIAEKAPKLGGVCAYSGGEVFVPCNHKATDDPEAAKAYLDFLAGGYADPELARLLFETGPVAARYLEESCGVKWKTIKDFPDYHYPHAPGTVASGRYLEVELFEGKSLLEWQHKTYLTPHMPLGLTHDELFNFGGLCGLLNWDFRLMGRRIREDLRGFGPGMMGYLLRAALVDRKIEARLKTAVTQLLVEDGRVVGAVLTSDGRETRVQARRGVMLGVGGYDWRPDLARYYEGLPEWNSAVQPSVTGDNHVLGGEIGAQLAGVPPHNLGMFMGYAVPGESHDGAPMFRASWEGGYPHALWVNRAGERFCDESFYREYLPKVHAWDGVRQTHPNFPVYVIFDASFRAKYGFGTFLPGMPLPEPLFQQAETPQALGEKLGIDGGALALTLERFNGLAEQGVDSDFGRGTYPWAAMMCGDKSRPNPNLGPVNTPPYFGARLVPVGVGINAVGLKTNAHAQVMHVRGHAIEGLYAAGNAAAALDTGAGYQSGLSNLRGMTWGFIAGRHAAASR